MNKYEKALNDLKRGTGGAEALEVAMEALEKQINVMPFAYIVNTNGNKKGCICSSCGQYLRKNPDDLPQEDGDYIICLKRWSGCVFGEKMDVSQLSVREMKY